MLTTLGWKELRELFPLVALALAVQAYLVIAPADLQYLYSFQMGEIPFVSGSLTTMLFVVAGTAAFVIGWWQTAWESGRGTFHFLLHRPASRTAIFGLKLLVGISATALISILPVVAYGLWAATPGTHASPFDWSMTAWCWSLCLRMPLVYLGAFLSGIYPAGWLGGRLFPVAASVVLLVLFEPLAEWPEVAGALAVVVEACFIWAILHVAATRDYS